MQDDRLKRLAASIDALAEKDDRMLQRTREIVGLRRKAAVQLHSVCAEFVGQLNRLISRTEVNLDPPHFGPDEFRDPGINLFQINVRGRILQIEFEATAELVSTEDFRIPYTLQGAVRCFNDQLLAQQTVQESLLFYCMERSHKMWRVFDARTYRSSAFDQDYLISLMEQLV